MLRRWMVLGSMACALVCLASALDRQPNTDYQARRKRLAQAMDGGTLVLFASTEASGGDAIGGYIPNKSFFYLTGWSEPGAALVIRAASAAKEQEPARPYREVLYLPKRNLLQERWTGAKWGPESASVKEKSGFPHVEALDRMRDDLTLLLPVRGQVVFTDVPGLGETSMSAAGIDWLRRSNAFADGASFRDVNPLVNDLRRIKDAGEMDLIRRATDASVRAHLAALRAIHAGVSEHALVGLMQFELSKGGCERTAYAPIVGSGRNGTVLHYASASGVLQEGELVVMDVGGEYSLYASDITRTAPVTGKFTARQRELYGIVLGAQQAAMAAVEAGKSTFTRTGEKSIYTAAYNYINTHGKDLHGQALGQYFIHGISHYIGLDVHDAGTPAPIEPGMVFSIEPGIYIPEEKTGIRIEDVFWMSGDRKLVNLSGALPRTADEVEAAMKAGTAK